MATARTFMKKIIDFLSHPAWNGASCFITAATALGLGSVVVAFVLGLFKRVQDLATWLLEPINTPRYVLVGGSIVFAAFIATSVQQVLRSRNRLSVSQNPKILSEPKLSFIPILLAPGTGNSYLNERFVSPPSGNVTLGGIQFQLNKSSLIFDTNKQIHYYLPLDNGGKQIDLLLPRPINRIRSVRFLINSGNSKTIYAGRSIGKISLVFKEAPPIDVELILGDNVREWCPGNSGDYVRETTNPQTASVWTGMNKDGVNAVMDCLSIAVYEVMKESFLEKITFTHKSIPQPPDTMGVHYSVFGISAQTE